MKSCVVSTTWIHNAVGSEQTATLTLNDKQLILYEAKNQLLSYCNCLHHHHNHLSEETAEATSIWIWIWIFNMIDKDFSPHNFIRTATLFDPAFANLILGSS